MILFNGTQYAVEMYKQIAYYAQLYATKHQAIKIASVLFTEDAGSRLYAEVKQAQAQQLGIDYQLHSFSLLDPIEVVLKTIADLNKDQTTIGIIIQKPWRKTWENAMNLVQNTDDVVESGITNYDQWWQTLYKAVDPTKDVDGLHPETISAIEDGTWDEKGKVLPATCKAVLYILEEVESNHSRDKIIIIGKSDLLGIPLYHVLNNRGEQVELLGKKDLEKREQSGQKLLDARVVISATGVHHLITGDMIGTNTVLIDVGEPKPDINQESVSATAAFLTPVPGGVGPVTVACLMQNAVYLAMGKTS